MTFYLMCGVPGSGKSTYVRTHFPAAHVICPDTIREEMFGKDYQPIPERERKVWDTAWRQLHDALAKKDADIVFDATSVTRGSRMNALMHIPGGVKKVCVVMKTPVNVALARNAGRDRVVPVAVINRMTMRLTYPSPDEGFDGIITVNV